MRPRRGGLLNRKRGETSRPTPAAFSLTRTLRIPLPLAAFFPQTSTKNPRLEIDLPAMPLLSSSKKPQKVVILGGGGEYRSSCLSLSANYRRGRSDGSSLEAPSPSPPYCRILAPCSLMIDSLSRRKSSHWSHGCSRSRPQGLCCYRRCS